MKYDFNTLEQKAKNLLASGLPHEAIKIYLYMADGDQSLDGGYLAKEIAQCYEEMKDCMLRNIGTEEPLKKTQRFVSIA